LLLVTISFMQSPIDTSDELTFFVMLSASPKDMTSAFTAGPIALDIVSVASSAKWPSSFSL
jgi:hypothetical protein